MQLPADPVLPSPDPRIAGQLGAALVVTAFALVPLAMLLARRIFPGRNVYFARWGFSHVVQVLLLVLALSVILGLAWPPRPGLESDSDAFVNNLLRSAGLFACAGAAIVLIARRMSPAGGRALGLAPDRNVRAIGAGLTSYAILFPGIFGLGLLSVWILSACGIEATGQDVMRQFVDLAPGELPRALLLGVVVMPFLEELIFRAFLQPLLVQNFSAKGGIALTSFLFAALHGMQAFLPIFGLSLVLGAVMLRTQRLAASFAIHATHNGLMLAVALQAPELAQRVHEVGGLCTP